MQGPQAELQAWGTFSLVKRENPRAQNLFSKQNYQKIDFSSPDMKQEIRIPV